MNLKYCAHNIIVFIQNIIAFAWNIIAELKTKKCTCAFPTTVQN